MMMTRTAWTIVLTGTLLAPAGQAAGQGRRPAPTVSVVESRVVRAERLRTERYQKGRHDEERIERLSRSIKIGATGLLDLSNISGDITVTSGGGSEIKLEATKRSHDKVESEARRMLSLVTIDIDERPGRVEVRTMYPQREHHVNVSVDYALTVPTGTSLSLKSISGDVRVAGVKGELRVESVSGDVRIDGASRVASVKSVSGDVEILATGTDGDLSASSVSGTVSARGVKARALDLGTVSGDVVMNNVTCERAVVRAVSGNLEFDGPLAASGRYEFQSHSGDVTITVSGGTGFEIAVTSFSGNIRSDLPIKVEGNGGQEGRRGRPHTSLRGQYGDGSASIQVSTFSGDVVLAKN